MTDEKGQPLKAGYQRLLGTGLPVPEAGEFYAVRRAACETLYEKRKANSGKAADKAQGVFGCYRQIQAGGLGS